MASAAYWIGSAASKVFTSNLTNMIGSIGVVQSHVDISRAQDMQGVKTTEITAGKYKRIASQYAPLSSDGRDTLQDQVNQVYQAFVGDVARNRGVSAQAVLDNMADGRVFIGQQAIDAGLVDGVSTLDDLIGRAAAGEFNLPVDGAEINLAVDKQQAHAAAGAPQAEVEPNQQAESAGDAPQATQEEKTMDVQTLKAEHPDVAEALINEGKELGATAERDRIKSVEAQSMPGHEALIATLKFDGKTSGPEAAVQVLAAEKAKKGDRLAALRSDAAAASVPHAATALGDEKDPEAPDDEQEDDDDEEAKNARIQKAGGPAAVAKAAREYRHKKALEGVKVSTAEAVAYVTKHHKEARHG
jgi:hypothetical protein